ncbi:CLF1 [Mytilus edulis]|uniref:CRN n=1 Tax=Mytilus edulis TaxID=6550 RepID=A0A8S3UWY7_MYTED|nr:CLF1 [Mytilus edulis]
MLSLKEKTVTNVVLDGFMRELWNSFGEDNIDERLVVAFAKFEEGQKNNSYRLDCIFQEVKTNPYNYDAWFDYLRLLEADGNTEQIRETYERAIANVLPSKNDQFICIFSKNFSNSVPPFVNFWEKGKCCGSFIKKTFSRNRKTIRAVNKIKWEKHLNSFPKHISAVNLCLTGLSDKAYCRESDKKFELDISPNGQLIPIEKISVQPVHTIHDIPLVENSCNNDIEPVPEYEPVPQDSEEVVIVEMTEEIKTIFTLEEEILNLTDKLVKERNQFQNCLKKMKETKNNLKSELDKTKSKLKNQKNKENQKSEKEQRRKDRKRSYQEPNKRIRSVVVVPKRRCEHF